MVKEFRQWFHHYRCFYNKTTNLIYNEFYVPRDENNRALWYDTANVNVQLGSKYDVRNVINGKGCVPSWGKRFHKDLRSEAAMNCYEMLKSAISNRKNKRGHVQIDPDKQIISYLKKKHSHKFCFPVPGPSVHVHKDARYITIFPNKTNDYKIKLHRYIPSEYTINGVLKHEMKIYFNGHACYICISKKVQKSTPENRKRLIALDPGIRKIAVGYDGKENLIYGEGVYNKINKYLKRRDYYQSIGDKRDILEWNLELMES